MVMGWWPDPRDPRAAHTWKVSLCFSFFITMTFFFLRMNEKQERCSEKPVHPPASLETNEDPNALIPG